VTIPHQQDEPWLIVVLGQFAGIMALVFLFMCAGFIVEHMQNVYPVLKKPFMAIVLVFPVVALLYTIQVFMHEMGHALAAWSVGRRVHLICIGYVGFVPRTGQFLWIQKPASAEYAGYVQTSPVWPDLSRAKTIWVSLGGPLATGTFGTAMILMMDTGAQATILLALGGFFIMDMVFNLIPMKWSRGSISDGLRIWRGWKGQIWDPDSWAATRLSVLDRDIDIVSDAEWTEIRKFIRQPFYGGTEFKQLLFVAALEKNDTKMLDILGAAHKAHSSIQLRAPEIT